LNPEDHRSNEAPARQTPPLDEIAAFVRRYVVLDDSQLIAVTLWVVHTHCVDALGITPYLAITSAEKESGKTRLLELLELLVAKPWLTGSATAATLARKIDYDQPTLLLDESDAAFSGDKEYAEALRGVLNTGFKARGKYSRCVGNGAALTVQDFSTFCAKAIAGIGKLPDTAESRSIRIRMKKKTTEERVERVRERLMPLEAEPIREWAAAWAAEIEPTVAACELAVLEELPDRAFDIWEPLLSIARLGGDKWFARAKKAAVALSGHGAVVDESIGVQLLADIKVIFDELGEGERVPSATLIEELHKVEESPWLEWKHGKPISANGLASLLKRYEIKPQNIRMPDGKVPKGYHRDQFEDVWKRHLPSTPPLGSATSATTAQPSQKQAISNRYADNSVAVAERAENLHEQRAVAAVADEKGGAEQKQPKPALENPFGFFDEIKARLRPIGPEAPVGVESYDGVAWTLCATCDSPYDESLKLAEPVTCPACVALRRGIVTASEAEEMRFRQRLGVAA
jgi:hypothetical protein